MRVFRLTIQKWPEARLESQFIFSDIDYEKIQVKQTPGFPEKLSIKIVNVSFKTKTKVISSTSAYVLK